MLRHYVLSLAIVLALLGLIFSLAIQLSTFLSQTSLRSVDISFGNYFLYISMIFWIAGLYIVNVESDFKSYLKPPHIYPIGFTYLILAIYALWNSAFLSEGANASTQNLYDLRKASASWMAIYFVELVSLTYGFFIIRKSQGREWR